MKVLHAGDYADSVADSGCLDFALFQVTAQSVTARRYGGLPNSQGEKDVGVECEQGGCDGKD